MDELCIVYITAADMEEAGRIGLALVEERLAACVNILDNVTSLYRWEGKIERSNETVIIAKTRKSLSAKLAEAVKKMHSYSCPCIEVLPVIDSCECYAKWVIAETA